MSVMNAFRNAEDALRHGEDEMVVSAGVAACPLKSLASETPGRVNERLYTHDVVGA